MISTAFREGGFGMWPTTLLGLLSLALVLRCAFTRSSKGLALIFGLGSGTIFSGLLGFTTGVMATLAHIEDLPSEQQLPILWIGLRESLNNVTLALIFATILAVGLGVAVHRSAGAARP